MGAHRGCYMQSTVTMSGADGHIAVQINSDNGQCLDSTLRSKIRTEVHVESERLQLQSLITNESQLQFGDPSYTATEPQ
jgi:hypothetical protein